MQSAVRAAIAVVLFTGNVQEYENHTVIATEVKAADTGLRTLRRLISPSISYTAGELFINSYAHVYTVYIWDPSTMTLHRIQI